MKRGVAGRRTALNRRRRAIRTLAGGLYRIAPAVVRARRRFTSVIGRLQCETATPDGLLSIPIVRDFNDSTLWRISTFERVRQETGSSGFVRLAGPTLLPTTLLDDLRRLDAVPADNDALEIIAACMRHRESALLCLQHDGLVWPVTLFPSERLYHSPRDLAHASISGIGELKVLTAEPPGVQPPGHWMHERVADAKHYHPLLPLLWMLALSGPRRTLLSDIAGHAAYRMVSGESGERLRAPGALGSAIERLQRESVSLREIALWPGMSTERASRLLNGLYLAGRLLVSRSHGAARSSREAGRGWFGWSRSKR